MFALAVIAGDHADKEPAAELVLAVAAPAAAGRAVAPFHESEKSMTLRFRTLLPALIVPTVLTVATTAHAALDISNGFITAKSPTAVGYDFGLSLAGTLVYAGISRATALQLECAVDTVAEDIDCEGVLTVQGTSAEIRMGFDGDSEIAHWSIAASAPSLLDIAHEQWGEEVVPNTMGVPPGWDYVEFFNGVTVRRFYYSTSWAETYESITGLKYGDIWEA
jgi:hypothetical protein